MADETPKVKTGIVRDPWRVAASSPQHATRGGPRGGDGSSGGSGSSSGSSSDGNSDLAADASSGDDITGDMQGVASSTIELKHYGGITVSGAETPTHAAARVLKFMVDNLRACEDTLTQYGVIVTKLVPGKLTTKFYVQRSDGWTLAVPLAESRDAGCLQLIQAILALRTSPSLREKMDLAKIRPFRTGT